MRARAKKRSADRMEYLRQNPSEMARVREKAMDKYYKSIRSRNERRLKEWLNDSSVKDSFKLFLRENVWEARDKMPSRFMKDLEALKLYADKQADENVIRHIEDAPQGCEEASETEAPGV
jgi:vacuolar-type H+-ATPase subunit H